MQNKPETEIPNAIPQVRTIMLCIIEPTQYKPTSWKVWLKGKQVHV